VLFRSAAVASQPIFEASRSVVFRSFEFLTFAGMKSGVLPPVIVVVVGITRMKVGVGSLAEGNQQESNQAGVEEAPH
jgi:hypothetical protein